METRRSFMQKSLLAGGLSVLPLSLNNQAVAWQHPIENKISLAIWSLVRSFRAGAWKLTDLARICREDFGIDGIEYVNSPFFEVPTSNYLNELNKAADDHGVKNVLIMVDGEGAMVAHDEAERKQAVINHRKWVDIAAYLGCHAIRCNAYGGGNTLEEDPDSLDRAADSFNELVEYAKPAKINIIIENHGGLSSLPDWLPKLAEKMDNPHFGLLPDYGNFPQSVDKYEAIQAMMPYAKGVSVKASWQPDRSHPAWSLERMMRISLNAGYSGFWGIESGMNVRSDSPEEIKNADWEAVKLTKEAIEKTVL